MALTDYDKKNLSSADQRKIQEATVKWQAANRIGNTALMDAAAAEAAAVRNAAGYKTDSSGNYISSNVSDIKPSNMSPKGDRPIADDGSYPATGNYVYNYGGPDVKQVQPNNQYTGVGSWNDQGVSDYATKQINYFKELYAIAQANGDEEGMRQAHEGAEAIRAKYGYSGGVDGSGLILLPEEEKEFVYPEPEQVYERDPRIDALLNEILNREDFSYDVANDPLYQQYAQMYRREGDRAMRDTMAEAAAGAGGMNSYAITAAQQANNYYSSQLNDKIPELYELAYQMYLGEKESKVQDLGLLQSMDATQYNRYRDTMNDWYADRDFAYGVYRDNVGDQQWQDTFNYNQYVDDRNYDYTVGRDAVDDAWREKEWEFTVDQTQKEDSEYEKERAQELVMWMYSNGMLPSDELLAQAGMEGTISGSMLNSVENPVEAYFAELDRKRNLVNVPSEEETAEEAVDETEVSDVGDATEPVQLMSTRDILAQYMSQNESYAHDQELLAKIFSAPEATDGWLDGSQYKQQASSGYYDNKVTGGGGSGSGSGSGSGDGDKAIIVSGSPTGNYVPLKALCTEVFERDGKQAALDTLQKAYATEAIDVASYLSLYNKFRDMKE